MNNKMNQEVELRAILTEDQRILIFNNLLTSKIYKGEDYLIDVYFCKNTVSSFAELEMIEIGSYSLRLRKKEQNGVVKIELNTKTITQYNDHNAWEEHEVQVSSFEEAKEILQKIGFKIFFILEKKRFTFSWDENTTVLIEDITDYKSIIEVEIITSKDNCEEAKKKLMLLLADLGINLSQIVPKSVTNLLMKEKAML